MKKRNWSGGRSCYVFLLTLLLAVAVGCGASSNLNSTGSTSWTPAQGDLRFQSVDRLQSTQPDIGTNVLGGGAGSTWTHYYGSPLEMGPGSCGSQVGNPYDCGWLFSVYSIAAGSFNDTEIYHSGNSETTPLSNSPDLALQNLVIRSLDIEPAYNAYAVAEDQLATASGYTATLQQMPIASLSSYATTLGSKGQVITALSFSSPGTVDVISYSWSGDPSSSYETTVASVTFDTLITSAQQMAAQGYIITAFGGDSQNGFYLVGTRLTGSTAPHQIQSATTYVGAGPEPTVFNEGYVVVAMMNNSSVNSVEWVLEK